jgi:hypothetical protein
MKDEELLKLASYFLTLHPIDENKPENLLKFARELYDEGYTKGFKVGHDAGWELNEEVSHRGL